MDQSEMPNQKVTLIKWIQNILESKVIGKKSQNTIYELEAKVGRFVGKNHVTQKYLNSMDENFYQLNKHDYHYEFQSKITPNMNELALQFLQKLESEPKYQLRLDLNFNTKDQRASYFYDPKESELCQAVLIEKKKNLSQHIDIVSKGLNYRISLSEERNLSNSIKDLLKQMEARSKQVQLVRIKKIQKVVQEGIFEYSLCTVYQFFKSMPFFQQSIETISKSSHFDAHKRISDLWDKIQEQRLPPEYELEIEILPTVNIEQIQKISEDFLERTEFLISSIKGLPPLMKKNSQDFNDKS